MTVTRPRVAMEHPGRTASRRHVDRMTGPLGLYQHANGFVPALDHGYCTDDVARMLIVDVRHAQRWSDVDLSRALERDMVFLEEAYSGRTGRFRNMRATDGAWLDGAGTPDSHGRAIQALAWVMTMPTTPRHLATRASTLMRSAIVSGLRLQEVRPLAYVVLGLTRIAAGQGGRPMRPLAREAAGRLAAMVSPDDQDWPWPEPSVTYDNGVLPQAIIHAGIVLGRTDLVRLGTELLDWLMARQVANGHLSPVGNRGWWPRGGEPAAYDQQPIEAASLLEAAAIAHRATGDPRWLATARMAFGWFLGDNDMQEAMADPEDGSCRDGLGPTGPNLNRGAESTLAWLMSVETMADLGVIAGHARQG